MTVYAVQYTYDTRSDRRDQVRPEHRTYLGRLHDEGTLLASGPFVDDGAPGALLVLSTGSVQEVDGLLDADPFVREGLVSGRVVREWTQVFGPWTP